jgi:hypothetical protein
MAETDTKQDTQTPHEAGRGSLGLTILMTELRMTMKQRNMEKIPEATRIAPRHGCGDGDQQPFSRPECVTCLWR